MGDVTMPFVPVLGILIFWLSSPQSGTSCGSSRTWIPQRLA